MAIGTTNQGGSNDGAVGDDRISIGSPADSSNHTLSHDAQPHRQDDLGQKTLEDKSSGEDEGDEERNVGDDRQQDSSMCSNLSSQSVDEEPTTSGGAAAGGAAHDKTSNGSLEENRLKDFTNNDNDDSEHREDEPFAWTPYAEVHLLNALKGLRPVGANYNFQINIIHGRFEAGMGIYIPREELVKKLNTWYNFDEALRICGGEDIPTNESSFSLPEDEFPECVELLKQNRLGDRN